jgi:hypothetical protein
VTFLREEEARPATVLRAHPRFSRDGTSKRLQDASGKLPSPGAHYMTDMLADFEEVVDEIKTRLTAGERP